MARVPRKEIFADDEVGIFHCVNRCVRRAYLCGRDSVTGQSLEHRREWIRERLEFLAGQFGIEVLGFAVISNHLHVILRSRPDVVAGWSDDEAARRWWRIFPQRRDAEGDPAPPTEADLRMLQADVKKFAEIRKRLSSVSWFMRCLAEPIDARLSASGGARLHTQRAITLCPARSIRSHEQSEPQLSLQKAMRPTTPPARNPRRHSRRSRKSPRNPPLPQQGITA